jgi:hypothetical protein
MKSEVDFWRGEAMRNVARYAEEHERRKADRIRYRSAILALLRWAKAQGKYTEALNALKGHE